MLAQATTVALGQEIKRDSFHFFFILHLIPAAPADTPKKPRARLKPQKIKREAFPPTESYIMKLFLSAKINFFLFLVASLHVLLLQHDDESPSCRLSLFCSFPRKSKVSKEKGKQEVPAPNKEVQPLMS